MARSTPALSVDTILRDRLIASVDRIVHMMDASAKAEAAEESRRAEPRPQPGPRFTHHGDR